MANYRTTSYFETRPDIVRLFEDLEAYQNWCRFELCDFNPADLYRKDSPLYSSYSYSKRVRRPYQGNKPRYDNTRKPAFENRYSR